MIASVYFELTHICNLSCKHCYNSSGVQNESYLDPALIFAAIDQSNLPKETIITLSGGEPLIHPGIRYLIEGISERGHQINMVTNGILIDEKFAALAEEKQISLQLSIDGPRIVHDYIRGKGVYDRLIHNVEILNRNYNMERAIVKAVLTKMLLGKIPEYVDNMISLGFGKITFGYLSHSGRSKERFYSQFSPTCEDLINLDYEIDKMKMKYPGRIIKPVMCYSCGLLHGKQKEQHMKVDVNGDVYICQGFCDAECSIGNIATDRIVDCMANEKYYQLISILRERQDSLDCSKCILARNNLCNKGCPAEEMNLHGNQHSHDDKCEYRVNRRLLDMVQKMQ